MKARRVIYRFVCRLLKVPEGCVAPAWVRWCLFPVLSLYERQTTVRIDYARNVFYLQGVEFSYEVLLQLKAPEGYKTVLSSVPSGPQNWFQIEFLRLH